MKFWGSDGMASHNSQFPGQPSNMKTRSPSGGPHAALWAFRSTGRPGYRSPIANGALVIARRRLQLVTGIRPSAGRPITCRCRGPLVDVLICRNSIRPSDDANVRYGSHHTHKTRISNMVKSGWAERVSRRSWQQPGSSKQPRYPVSERRSG